MSGQLIIQSKAFYDEYDFLKSINYAEKALEQVQDTQDNYAIIESLYLIAKSEISLSKFNEALENCDKALSLLSNNQEFFDSKSYLNWNSLFYALKGTIFFKKGVLNASEDFYMKSKEIFEKLNNRKELAITLNGLAKLKFVEGKLLEAEHHVNEAIRYQMEVGDNKGISWSFSNMGNILVQKGFIEIGLFYYERAYEKARTTNNLDAIINALNGIGIVCYYSGKLEIALENYSNSCIIANQIGDYYRSSLSLSNIAAIFSDQGRSNLALKFLQKGLEYGKEIINDYDLTGIYDKLGLVYQDQGHLDEAMDYFKKALTIQKKAGNNFSLSYCHRYIGNLYFLQGNFRKSEEHLIEALRLIEGSGNNFLISGILFYIVNLLLSQSKVKEAEYYYNRLLKISNVDNNMFIDLFQKITKALIVKSLPQKFQQLKAKTIFKEILSIKKFNKKTHNFCQTNLCEILIYEFQETKNLVKLREIKQILEELYTYTEEEKAVYMKLNLLIYESQIALICEDYEKSNKLLNEGYRIAKNQKLNLFTKKIEEKRESYSLKESRLPPDYKIAITTHELRKPITVIKGFTEFLLRYIDNTESKDREQALRLILKNVNHLNRLIEGINDLSIETGFLTCNKELVDFNEFFNNLITQYKLIYTKKIIYYEVERIIDPLLVFIDKNRIQQVFDNIIENADNFTSENGHIWMKMSWNNNDICIEISDDGCGIKKNDLKYIFDPFSTSGSDPEYKGTGIGLYLAKIICDNHQATIQAKSFGKNQGATFLIKIPRTHNLKGN